MKKLNWDFNPRSLAGATTFFGSLFHNGVISIHAPSRERPKIEEDGVEDLVNFNPRSLAGATWQNLYRH